MKKIQDKPGGRPQRNGRKSRKGSQHEADRVAVLRHQEGAGSRCASVNMSGKQLFRQRSILG